MAVSIEYPHDPRLADYADLRRRRPDWFIVESALAVERLLASPYEVRSLLVSPTGLARLATELAATTAPVYVAELDVLRAVVGFNLHRGVLASAQRRGPASSTTGRHGASARRARGDQRPGEPRGDRQVRPGARRRRAGARPDVRRPAQPPSVRVSMGEILHLPMARAADWPTTIATMRAAGMEVWALTPRAGAVPIRERAIPPRLALIVGAEGPGLAAATIAAATAAVRIPIHADVDSLNVAHAVSVALAMTTDVRV